MVVVIRELRLLHLAVSKITRWGSNVGILGKVCGDTWQSMWRYLAKYVDILEMGSKHLYVMSYEMRVCFLSVVGGILESLVGESLQFFRR